VEIEVFPSTEALTVSSTAVGVLLSQNDEGLGHDVQVFIPLSQVENACRAIRAAAKAAKESAGRE